MTAKSFFTLAATALVLGSVYAQLHEPAPARARDGEPRKQAELTPAERGKHLVDTAACHDCHTPLKMGKNGPERDLTRLLSGHPSQMSLPPPPKLDDVWNVATTSTMTAWAGPWGTSFTANLTPDRETGLGTWTAENFVQTIRKGRHMGSGRSLLPPMPVEVYANFSDDDLRAIFAYLQTIPAVKNRVPQPLPPASATH